MLASVDMKNAKYATSIQALEPRLQAIVDLEDMVVELLRAFVDKTMKKPERILFYRDRVLQGQFVQVHRDEVAVIRPACKKLYVTYVSKITPSSEATSTPAQCNVLCNENRFHVGQFPETGRHTVLLCARCTRSVVMVPAAF
ncbi:hypothetical protein K457DRAFT_1881403 [Linnemannia elongata AG-77]|uniref:Piwi domain-containing protein n=1 Tax=Linnemannia elongata AG-77 TaxID=1314771 RepID=A0A197JEW9_9FUNG|nr:hypothetical protein K457DRAFT_1881403 [Linnemannia elongata AG-77]